MLKKKTVLAFALLCLGGCFGSYTKTCSDGVCKIVENGQVRYEGPPDKVAARKAQDEATALRAQKVQAAYDTAPKRPPEEPVRVAFLLATSSDPDLAQYTMVYNNMLRQEFGAVPGIVLVEPGSLSLVLNSQGASYQPGFGSMPSAQTESLGERLTKVRDSSIDVDVVIFTELGTKKQTGVVAGRGGAGTIEVQKVEFQGTLSSVYKVEERRVSEVGNSTDSIEMFGRDNRGQTRSANLKQKRDLEKDRPAVQRYVAAIKQIITGQIAPTLPSLAAISEIRQQYPGGATDDKTAASLDALRRAFQKK